MRGETVAATARLVGGPVPPLARVRGDLDPGLCAAIDRALSPSPQARGTLAALRPRSITRSTPPVRRRRARIPARPSPTAAASCSRPTAGTRSGSRRPALPLRRRRVAPAALRLRAARAAPARSAPARARLRCARAVWRARSRRERCAARRCRCSPGSTTAGDRRQRGGARHGPRGDLHERRPGCCSASARSRGSARSATRARRSCWRPALAPVAAAARAARPWLWSAPALAPVLGADRPRRGGARARRPARRRRALARRARRALLLVAGARRGVQRPAPACSGSRPACGRCATWQGSLGGALHHALMPMCSDARLWASAGLWGLAAAGAARGSCAGRSTPERAIAAVVWAAALTVGGDRDRRAPRRAATAAPAGLLGARRGARRGRRRSRRAAPHRRGGRPVAWTRSRGPCEQTTPRQR